jgi:hypothetical protein
MEGGARREVVLGLAAFVRNTLAEIRLKKDFKYSVLPQRKHRTSSLQRSTG